MGSKRGLTKTRWKGYYNEVMVSGETGRQNGISATELQPRRIRYRQTHASSLHKVSLDILLHTPTRTRSGPTSPSSPHAASPITSDSASPTESALAFAPADDLDRRDVGCSEELDLVADRLCLLFGLDENMTTGGTTFGLLGGERGSLGFEIARAGRSKRKRFAPLA
jgi:hypothetical protein